MSVCTQRFLFVGFADHETPRAVENREALGRVVLEWLPRYPVVHTFVYREAVGLFTAELQVDVSEFVLLAKRQGKSDVLVIAWQHGSGMPTGEIVGIVEVGEIRGRMRVRWILGVAIMTLPFKVPLFLLIKTESGRRGAARAARRYCAAERGVNKVGHTFDGPVTHVVVTRILRSVL